MVVPACSERGLQEVSDFSGRWHGQICTQCAPQDTTLVTFQPHGDEVCVSAVLYAAAKNFHVTSWGARASRMLERLCELAHQCTSSNCGNLAGQLVTRVNEAGSGFRVCHGPQMNLHHGLPKVICQLGYNSPNRDAVTEVLPWLGEKLFLLLFEIPSAWRLWDKADVDLPPNMQGWSYYRN